MPCTDYLKQTIKDQRHRVILKPERHNNTQNNKTDKTMNRETENCSIRKNRLLILTLALMYYAVLLSPTVFAAEDDNPGVVIGTLTNMMDYYSETLTDLRDKGMKGPVYWPQSEYESGLGPVNVIPEFVADLGLQLGPLYLLDVPTLPFEFRFYVNTPEVPAKNRKVVGITEDDGFTDPHIPPLRWSADGRLGVESQVGGSLASPAPVSLYLLAPEKLEKPFVDSPAGPNALVMEKVELPFSELAGGRTGSIQHTNICDPYTPDEGARRNPYSCGDGGQDDCYDVVLISSYVRLSNTPPEGGEAPPKLDDWDRLMGTPLHIRVSNPKTPDARIAEVVYGEPEFTPNRTGILFETITPADGRLMIARRGFLPLLWENQAKDQIEIGSYDVVYGIAPPEADPCDVSYWGDLYPITHAPYDDRVNTRYPFAMQPFRDPTGAVIPDSVDIKGTYPWMDKEAKNFSIQVSGAKLFPSYAYDKNPQSRYPLRCVSEEECDIQFMQDNDSSKDNMFMLIGAWTQGKMVLVDGMLNDVDFRLGGLDKNHSYLSLYKPGTGKDPGDNGEVRVGTTRGATIPYPVFNDSGELVGNYKPANMSMLDSVENRLNFLPNMQHSRFQDVVWNMSSGHSTVEFSFDDYINPDGFIVSNMVAHMEHKSNNWYRMLYFDGWHQLSRTFNAQVRVQNSATALPERWNIPSHGRVYNGRMEPVANGGIRGKGMWFNGGTTRIDYDVPEQPQSVYESDWFYSLFIDPRFGDDRHERVLMRFPDKSLVTLMGLREVRFYNSRQRLITQVALPHTLPEQDWSQLALLVNAEEPMNDHQTLTLFVNGFHHFTWSGSGYDSAIERSNFRPTPGTLRLGKGTRWGGKRAFKGWMDEFKVFAYEPEPESICNFAHGTLVGLPQDYNGYWRDIANRYQPESHEFVSAELKSYGQPRFEKYACFHDFSGDRKAHKFNLPDGTVALRDAIHFPEGPLYHDAPRPDSTTNEFCLSCHTDSSAVPGLRVAPLALNTTMMAKDDPRRQPTQPPAKVYGNIPANWFPGAPDYAFATGPGGVKLDEWVLPGSEGVGPVVRNLALADEHGHAWKGLDEGDTVNLSELPADITQLRVNVNGLTRSVVITVNGYEQYDDTVPFMISTDMLQEGVNQIDLLASDDHGEQVSVSINLNVEL